MNIEFSIAPTEHVLEKLLKRHPWAGSFWALTAYVLSSLSSLFLWLLFILGCVAEASSNRGISPRMTLFLFLISLVAMFVTLLMLASSRASRKALLRKCHAQAHRDSKDAMRIDYCLDETGLRRTNSGVEEFLQWTQCFTSYSLDDDSLVLYKHVWIRAVVPCPKKSNVRLRQLADLLDSVGLRGAKKFTDIPSDGMRESPRRWKKAFGYALVASIVVVTAVILIGVGSRISGNPPRALVPFLWTADDKGIKYNKSAKARLMNYKEVVIDEGNFAISVPARYYSTAPDRHEFESSGQTAKNARWIFRDKTGPWCIVVSYVRKKDGETFLRKNELLHAEDFEPISFGNGYPAPVNFGPGRVSRTFSLLLAQVAVSELPGLNFKDVKLEEEGFSGVRDIKFMEKHRAIGLGLCHAIVLPPSGAKGRMFQTVIVRKNEAWRIQTYLPLMKTATRFEKDEVFAFDALYAGDIIGTFRILD